MEGDNVDVVKALIWSLNLKDLIDVQRSVSDAIANKREQERLKRLLWPEDYK